MKLENDRKRIVLLRHKVVKSLNDQNEYDRLIEYYPDNERFEADIYMELNNFGFLKYTGKDSIQNNIGDWVEQEPFDVNKYFTTLQGELSLGGLFESESLSKSRDQRFKKIESLGIIIAAIGGLITLLTFLYDLIKDFI